MNQPHTSKIAWPWLKASVCGLMALSMLWFSERASRLSRWNELETHARPAPSDEQACARCHPGIVESFAQTGHRQTLNPATDPVLQRLFAVSTDTDRTRSMETFVVRDGRLMAQSTAANRELVVAWIFGSGRHARTPVSMWNQADGRLELLEHGVSWYPRTGLAPTLGLEEASVRGEGLQTMGVLHANAAAENCFGCHTTDFPTSSTGPDWKHVVAGVRCDRCHHDTTQHLVAAERGEIAIERWSDLSPLESVNRCGECHRRSDHFPTDEIRPDNAQLLRFASVGLVQSPCFLQQTTIADTRLDCVSCHDPHQPLESDVTRSLQVCRQCHAGSNSAKSCSQAPSTSNCLPCHMPKTPVHSALSFTNHWIQRRP